MYNMYSMPNPNRTRAMVLPQANYSLIMGTNACMCRCIRRPTWIIPQISGVKDKNNDDVKLLAERIHLAAEVNGSIVSVCLSQTFQNPTNSPME